MSAEIFQFFPTSWKGKKNMACLKRILHVDDDEDIRVIVRMTLELVGNFDVLQCASGPEAMRRAKDFEPQILLLDVMMPEMCGVETWKNLAMQPELKDVPAVFMTAKAESQFSERLIEQGAASVITKPFEPTELCKDLEQIWRTWVSQAAE